MATLRNRCARLARALAVTALFALAVLTTASSPSAKETRHGRNNYYSYRDANGMLHISNIRRSKGDWKLWKSFEGSGSGRFTAPLPNRPSVKLGRTARARKYDSLIRDAARRYDLPVALVRAVVHTESNYNPRAVSSVGAMGLMQIMPSTAKYLRVRDAFDPNQNVYGGCKFLRLLANRFNGDMVLTIAGYHAGAGAVQKYGGVPPYESTRAYVKAVMRRYYAYERQQRIGTSAARREPARHILP